VKPRELLRARFEPIWKYLPRGYTTTTTWNDKRRNNDELGGTSYKIKSTYTHTHPGYLSVELRSYLVFARVSGNM
jgi:hypothetical protein